MASYKNIVVLAVAAVVVFLVLFAAYRPTASHPVFNSTYYVLNQHIPELLSGGARSVGLIFGQNSSGSVVLYFLNPYDGGANYTAANINSTVVNMINNGSLQLIVLPTPPYTPLLETPPQ